MPVTTLVTRPTDLVITYDRPLVEWHPDLATWTGPGAGGVLSPTPNEAWRSDYRLQATGLNLRANGLDSATLVYRYSSHGQLGPEPNPALTAWGSLGNLLDTTERSPTIGDYVRIAYAPGEQPEDPPLYWYGVILAENDTWARESHDPSDPNPEPQEIGTTTLRVVGLEHFLARTQITSAVVADTSAGADPEAHRRVGRAFTFNGGVDGLREDGPAYQRANRDPTLRTAQPDTFFTEQFYTFASGDPAITPQLWNAWQMIDYLLAHHNPRDESNPYRELPCRYRLGEGAELLEKFTPTIPTEGRTPLEVISQIARPSRGLCWSTEYKPEEPLGPTLVIHVHSISSSDLPLPSGQLLTGNPNQFHLDPDGDPTGVQLQWGAAGEARYDAIRFRGAKQTVTFTVSPQDGNLVKDWRDEDETEYKTAASGAGDYPAEEADQKRRNDAMRGEPKFDRVYAAWRIPDSWDQKVGDGSGGVAAGNRKEVFAKLDEYGDPIEIAGEVQTEEVFLPAMRFMEETRLPAAISSTGRRQYEPPMIYLPDAEGKFRLGERMNDAAAPSGTDRLASYHVRVEESGLAIGLVSTAGLSHTLAKTDFAGAAPSRREGEIDWQTMRATVTVESDVYCEAVYREAGTVQQRPLEELVIDMGEGYRLDYLAPHTVTGVEDGELTINAAGGLLRDDRQVLADLAAAAMQWYRLPRRSLTASWRNLIHELTPGVIITDVGQAGYTREVGRVVGEVSWNYEAGTTLVKTLDGSVEVGGMLA